MKVLITGGAGFIGSHVVDLVGQTGYEPVVVDNLSTGKREFIHPSYRLYEIDITSPFLKDVFKKEKPDVVIHLAAQVDVAFSIKDPVSDASQNILGTIHLLNCCQEFNVKKFIFSSSCAVYGEKDDVSIMETSPLQPLSYYGISKYTSELYIQTFNKLHQLPFTILRYANVYGPRQTPKGEGGVVSIFFNKTLKGESPIIFGDGGQTRDFVYVKDVALANLLSIHNGKNEIFNIGCNSKTSINELYNKIKNLSSKDVSAIYMPARDGDIRHSRLDINKASTILGWQPSFNLETGLVETLAYYQSK
ncbi:NAD-dependent epimerase/dehydratase family protein [Neobacillus sp. LXY-4]|uniref:NAD-dependent epimerase/dehydratase family protein n=1 Tax=Neobacillus sp. LXY-4 TaxID=3379826 RepID=UPI003EDFFB91